MLKSNEEESETEAVEKIKKVTFKDEVEEIQIEAQALKKPSTIFIGSIHVQLMLS